MRKLVFVLLLMIIFLAGCVQQVGECGGDNVLVMEFMGEEEIKTIPDQTVEIGLYLKNPFECDEKGQIIGGVNIKAVDLIVSNPSGLKLLKEEIDCDDQEAKRDMGCHFDLIDAGDEKEIYLHFKTPSRDVIGNIGQELKPEITLEYDYFGQTVFAKPIVKHEETTSATMEPSQKRGPIKAKVSMGAGIEDESKNFIREGNPVPIRILLEDVINSESEVKINKESFRLTLDNFEVDRSLGECNFEGEGKILEPIEDISLPMEDPLVCVLKAAKDFKDPWVPGRITVDFSYRYKLTATVTVKVITELG